MRLPSLDMSIFTIPDYPGRSECDPKHCHLPGMRAVDELYEITPSGVLGAIRGLKAAANYLPVLISPMVFGRKRKEFITHASIAYDHEVRDGRLSGPCSYNHNQD
jgi:hypothetical protein